MNISWTTQKLPSVAAFVVYRLICNDYIGHILSSHMNSITTNFTTIVNKQKQLNYYGAKLVRQPASLTDIRKTEEALQVTFNDELRELYSFADGTEFEAMTPSGLTGLIPIHSFLALNDAVEYYKQSMEYKESFHNHTTGYIPGKQMFPFLEDGAGNCYWVDLN